MDGRAAIGMDRGILKRIVALLFALAELADCASHASWPVRVLVLAILRQGETAARQLLVETSHPSAQSSVAVTPAGSSPADAMALALSLRLLALALAELLAEARRLSPLRPGRPSGQRSAVKRRPDHEVHDLHWFGCEALAQPDTS